MWRAPPCEVVLYGFAGEMERPVEWTNTMTDAAAALEVRHTTHRAGPFQLWQTAYV